MDNLTQEQIEQIYRTAYDSEFGDRFCVFLARFMMGFLRLPSLDESDFENARQAFFKQIKRHLDGKEANANNPIS